MYATFATTRWLLSLARTLALIPILALALALGGCATPAPPARQVQEYQRHNAVGLEKHAAGQIAEARNAFERALARAELDDDSRMISTALLNLAATELLLDDTEVAGQAYARASREAKLAGDAGLVWQAISGLAEAARRLGQPAKALDLLASRPDPGKDLSTAIWLAAEVSRARAMADHGQPGAALQLLAQIETSARLRPAPDPALAAVLHSRASVLLSTGQTKEAAIAAQAGLDIDRALHHPPSVADDHRLLGQIAAAQNDVEGARHHTQRALTIFAKTGQEHRAAMMRTALQKLSAQHSSANE